MLAGQKGDSLPVSAFPVDGTWPTGTTQLGEAQHRAPATSHLGRTISASSATSASLVCPHAAIRSKVYASGSADRRRARELPARVGLQGQGPSPATTSPIQVAPEDCTGCGLCVEGLPRQGSRPNPQRKAINMQPHSRRYEITPRSARTTASSSSCRSWSLVSRIPRSTVPRSSSPVPAAPVRVLGRLRGLRRDTLHQAADATVRRPHVDRNATGCSSIYGGNLPTTPYTNDDGWRGPAWSNSLFEDNAEFGLGMRLGDRQATREQASELLMQLRRVALSVTIASRRPPCSRQDQSDPRPGSPGQRERWPAEGEARAAIR